MQCVVPQLPSFVSINPRVTTRIVGESITYRCDEHYLIEGSGENRLTAVCTSNGEWSRRPPRCVGEIEKCSKFFQLIVFLLQMFMFIFYIVADNYVFKQLAYRNQAFRQICFTHLRRKYFVFMYSLVVD